MLWLRRKKLHLVKTGYMCNQHQHWQYQARYGLHLTQQLLFLILMDMEMNELLIAIPCKLTC